VDPKKEMAQNHKHISRSIKVIGNQTISHKKIKVDPSPHWKQMKKTLKDCGSYNIRGSKPKEDFSNTSRSLKKTYGFIEERRKTDL
jgi:hypothetical protein